MGGAKASVRSMKSKTITGRSSSDFCAVRMGRSGTFQLSPAERTADSWAAENMNARRGWRVAISLLGNWASKQEPESYG